MANSRWLSELAREKMWSRLHILPLLQAEEDRDQARRFFADKARERELLGQETKVYNSDRCVFWNLYSLALQLGARLGTILTGVVSSALHSSIPPPSSPSERDKFTTATATPVISTTRWRCRIFSGSRVSDVGRYMSFGQGDDTGEGNCTMGILPGRSKECLLDAVDIPSQLICFSSSFLAFMVSM